jgi:hypothetical protein
MRARDALDPRYVYRNRNRIRPYLSRRVAQLQRRGRELIRLPRRLHLALNEAGIPVTPNEYRLRKLKDVHKGQRAFVIGMGPSLRISDLDRLKGEVTFACNKVYLAFDETDWRPTYYSVVDIVLAKQNRADIERLDLHKVFGSNVRPVFGDSREITYMRQMGNPWRDGSPLVRFSENVVVGVNGGWTVLYPQLQLAHYMGIREVYLIGVDFSFEVPEPTGETSDLGEEILQSSGEEVNHFHPDYRKPGEKWTMPKLAYQYLAFQSANRAFRAAGGTIVNVSRTTALDVFPRRDFDGIARPRSTGPTR